MPPEGGRTQGGPFPVRSEERGRRPCGEKLSAARPLLCHGALGAQHPREEPLRIMPDPALTAC